MEEATEREHSDANTRVAMPTSVSNIYCDAAATSVLRHLLSNMLNEGLPLQRRLRRAFHQVCALHTHPFRRRCSPLLLTAPPHHRHIAFKQLKSCPFISAIESGQQQCKKRATALVAVFLAATTPSLC
jgi:hypothetical protein